MSAVQTALPTFRRLRWAWQNTCAAEMADQGEMLADRLNHLLDAAAARGPITEGELLKVIEQALESIPAAAAKIAVKLRRDLYDYADLTQDEEHAVDSLELDMLADPSELLASMATAAGELDEFLAKGIDTLPPEMDPFAAEQPPGPSRQTPLAAGEGQTTREPATPAQPETPAPPSPSRGWGVRQSQFVSGMRHDPSQAWSIRQSAKLVALMERETQRTRIEATAIVLKSWVELENIAYSVRRHRRQPSMLPRTIE